MVSEQILEWLETKNDAANYRKVFGHIAIASDVGLKRTENQDRVAVLRVSSSVRSKGFICACVCDGMGGLDDGGLAASTALAGFFSSLIKNRNVNTRERLEIAVADSNLAVTSATKTGGSTLSAVAIDGDKYYTVNVGDSRVYSYQSSKSERIQRLTTDDTMEEAYGSSGRGLLQYIGLKGEIIPHIHQFEISGHEVILITSDGAHLIGDRTIEQFCRYSDQPLEICTRTVTLARWLGGIDNSTMVALEVNKLAEVFGASTSSDISVWSLLGRLKLIWGDASDNRKFGLEREQTAISNIDEKLKEQHLDNSGPHGGRGKRAASSNSENNNKSRKKSPSKKDQIELGFSDEDKT
jgi:PPM family protein phosphatase